MAECLAHFSKIVPREKHLDYRTVVFPVVNRCVLGDNSAPNLSGMETTGIKLPPTLQHLFDKI